MTQPDDLRSVLDDLRLIEPNEPDYPGPYYDGWHAALDAALAAIPSEVDAPERALGEARATIEAMSGDAADLIDVMDEAAALRTALAHVLVRTHDSGCGTCDAARALLTAEHEQAASTENRGVRTHERVPEQEGVVSDKSAIEWTDATWNPVTGCSKVSAGCKHCYAETLSLRFGHSKKPWTAANAAENVVLHPERLRLPLTWREPRMVFVNSMSDLFHELVPDEYVGRVFEIMAGARRHTFQVLTKRPERMARVLGPNGCGFYAVEGPVPRPQPNVWMGTSIESDRWVGRADHLRSAPAAIRFLSLEPLLGPLPSLDLSGIDWAIVGGESGLGHRPIDPDWVRDLRDRCVEAGVAFFFKQWGGRTPKSGGRELDGRTWDEMPRVAVAA